MYPPACTNVPIEDSDEAREERLTVIDQMNSTLDSPKTHENEQTEKSAETQGLSDHDDRRR